MSHDTEPCRRQACADRQAAGDGRAGRHAALEDACAPGLRLGPAVVGRVRDGVRARRPRRSLGHGRLPDLADLDRHRRAAGDRRRLVPPDRPRLPDERRAHTSWRGRISARSPAWSGRPRCSSTTCSRSPYRSRPACSPSPRQLRRLPGTAWSCRSCFVVLLTVVNLRGVRESGIALRAADVRVRRRDVRARRARASGSAPRTPAHRPRCRTRSPPARGR